MTTTQAALLEAQSIRAIVAKMRADLTAVGGFDNELLGVPAGGVRAHIEALEAALSAAEAAQPEPVLWQFRHRDEQEWEEVKPWNPRMQTLEERIRELRAFTYKGQKVYEVRALYAASPQPAPIAAQAERCPNCDDTGDVTSIIGEWRGYCHCDAGQELAAQAFRGEVPGHGLPDWPADLQTFGERVAYQRGIGDARRIAAQAGDDK